MRDLFAALGEAQPDTNDSVSPPVIRGRVAVLLPIPLGRVLDYGVPEGMTLPPPGSLVEVPLGGRMTTGVVWHEPDGTYPAQKLKLLGAQIDGPRLSDDVMATVDFAAAYTMASKGAVLRMVLSSPEALKPAPVHTRVTFKAAPKEGLRITPARARLLHHAPNLPPLSVAELAEKAGVSDSVVRGLVDAGVLEVRRESVDQPYPDPDAHRPGPALRAEQAAAASALIAGLGTFHPTLLEGVTGSGKTEVYFELVAAALKADPAAQILVMVPEIGLTSQWLDRFETRFGCPPIVWHSDIGEAARRRAWRRVADGSAKVIVGARSALFLPFQNLSAIIVDEEHDPSFKQEEGVIYHARDMAVVRARAARCPVVMASATPSLETRQNVKLGRFHHVILAERHGSAVLPAVRSVDMRRDAVSATQWIAPNLLEGLKARLERGEQSLLFLNRRGYAPLTLCRTCGHRFGCPNCSTWLVEHRYKRTLECHQCGHTEPAPDACPSCDAPDSLTACGPGVERLLEEVQTLLPAARVAVMTSDTMQRPKDVTQLVDRISGRAVDIIIGTQLVTKGYHFPNLTLVGVIDADLGLRGGDLRAAERTYQQLTQVAGRAGRAERPGEVLLQTYDPQHPVVSALVSGDIETFLALETDARERFAMPPFGRLAALILSGEDEGQVMAVGRKLAQAAPAGPGLTVLGPAPAPIARLKGKVRARFLVQAPKDIQLQPIIGAWLKRVGKTAPVKIKVDIDPYSFL